MIFTKSPGGSLVLWRQTTNHLRQAWWT